MNIKDKHELLALHRCLFEAKFSPSPYEGDIAGSPITAKLANAVVDELAIIEGEKWTEWRKCEKHPVRVENLVAALKTQNLSHIKIASAQQKFIIDALAPLIADQQ